MVLTPRENNIMEMYLKMEELQAAIAEHYRRLQFFRSLHHAYAELELEGLSLQEKWELLDGKEVTGKAAAMKLRNEKNQLKYMIEYGSQEVVDQEIVQELEGMARKEQFQADLARTLRKMLLNR